MSEIALYPSNWLMMAGIIGFLKVFSDDNFKSLFKVEDYTLKITNFEELKKIFFETYFKYKDKNKIKLRDFYNNSWVANNAPKINGGINFDKLKKYFITCVVDSNYTCFFCNQRKAIKRNEELAKLEEECNITSKEKLISNDYKLVILNECHFTPLSASHKEFQNMFWEGKSNLFLCLPCELIIYCAAFAFSKVGNSYYFINAPASIKEVMEINDVWNKWFSNQSNSDEKIIQNSIIEILKHTEEIKAKWSIQNISIIKLKGEQNTFDVYTMNIPEDVANAMRKMIQAYPNSLKEVYDIFLYYVYERKPLYNFVDTIFYGFLTKEKIKVKESKLEKYIQGKLLLIGRKGINNIKDLLFFLKFQKEVENMENNFINDAFEVGRDLQKNLFGRQGINAKKTIERFTYKFLEALRRQDSGDLSYQLIRFYQNFEKGQIPQFFVNVLKDKSSLSQIGYAFLLGLNSYNEVKSSSKTENDQNDQFEEVENIENTEQEEE